MKRYAAIVLLAISLSGVLSLVGVSCQAQFLKKLEQGLLNSQGQGPQQGPLPGQQIGSVNLPPAQYMMTNVQTGQAFYVTVQNGQMFFGGQPAAPNMMAPGQGMFQPQQPPQQGGIGGLINSGFGNLLKNGLAPQAPPQQQVPDQ